MTAVAGRPGFTSGGALRHPGRAAGSWADDVIFGLMESEFPG